MADTLQLLLLDYNLSISPKNVSAFTTDCGANIIKAIKNLDMQHVPCFGHAFNTAVGNIFKLEEIQIAVNKTQKIQNIFAHSWQAVREMKIEQERFGLKKLKLPSYSKTRWWSLLDLISVILDQELGISSFLKTYKNGQFKKLVLSDDEIDVLKSITMILKPVREITDHLAGESYVTASAVYPVIFNLKTKLSEAVNSNNITSASNEKCIEIKKKIFSSIIEVLDKRYNNNIALKICMVLDPRFKTTFIAQEEMPELKIAKGEYCLESWMEWSLKEMHSKEDGNLSFSGDSSHSHTMKKQKTGLSAIFDVPSNNDEVRIYL